MTRLTQDLDHIDASRFVGALAVEQIEQLRPDLAIVDISLRSTSGLDLIKDLKARQQEVPVLVISMHDESLYAERVLRAGGRGYVMKQEGGRRPIATNSNPAMDVS